MKNKINKNVKINQSGLDSFAWFIVVLVLILIIFQVMSLMNGFERLKDIEKLSNGSGMMGELIGSSKEALIKEIIIDILSIIIEILLTFGFLSALYTIKYNRELIIDTNTILNETAINENGMKKIIEEDNKDLIVSNEFLNFMEEFENFEDEYYCDCGCQLFEDDEVCPNCGKKLTTEN